METSTRSELREEPLDLAALSDEERQAAEDRLRRYLALAFRIYERLEAGSHPQVEALTTAEYRSTIRLERSTNPSQPTSD